jgi:Uma2 family endonuclease
MVRPVTDEDDFIWEGPSASHQVAVRNLALALMKHCPRGLEVLPGPLVVRPFNEHLIQPDVVVVKRASLQADDGPLTAPPVLIAEVIDERSRAWDRQLKPMLYAKNGVEHYWHFDPEIPEFVAYQMDGAAKYKKVVTAQSDERVGFDAPVLVEICPARLRFKA